MVKFIPILPGDPARPSLSERLISLSTETDSGRTGNEFFGPGRAAVGFH